jgi:hypothetical protein
VKISRRKDEKTVRKPKRQKSTKNSMTRGHAQITRKSDNQDKVCPRKAKKKEKKEKRKKKGESKKSGKRKRGMTQRVELLIMSLSL